MATDCVPSNDEVASPTAYAEYELGGDVYGSTCMDGAATAEGTTSLSNTTVPSRTLKLTAPTPLVLDEDHVHSTFEKYGQLHSIDTSQQANGTVFVRFYDLRCAMEAKGGHSINDQACQAEYASDAAAREFDEEGRVVVRVEEHLSGNELCHIFSTYGDVRNIQDVPNVNIHKVVEFFDTQCAIKAVEALNAVDTDAMHAASVAYLEKTRCKLFLIPPRLPEAAGFVEGGIKTTQTVPKTFPLGGAIKAVVTDLHEEIATSQDARVPESASKDGDRDLTLPRLFDSSSSLFGSVPDVPPSFPSIPPSSASIPSFSYFSSESGMPLFADQSSNDSSAGLSLREVLPSGLGLYEDEEADHCLPRTHYQDSAAYEILSATRSCGWNPGWNNGLLSLDDGSFDGFSPLTTSLMEQLGGGSSPVSLPLGLDTSFMSEQQKQDVAVLSQYLDCYERATLFQQAVRWEVMKRLSSLKSFDTSADMSLDGAFQNFRSGEDWKSASRSHPRKKGGRFPRRSSALDLEQEAERRAQQEKMFAMDLERVRSGKDKRTTLMIKNIPNKYTQKMLLTRIEQEFKGTFDFFYLPIDFKNKCNVGYGFINMTSTDHIVSFVEHVHQQKWDKFNSDKVCCVTYARIQGRHALINHFQNSSLMLEDSKHQPLLFKNNGEPEPFPMKPVTA